MNNSMNEKYGIPSLENIKEAYNEVIPLMEKLNTKQDVIEFGKKYNVTMEINYNEAEDFDETESIDVIRCDVWKDLTYIYVYKNGTKPIFDVWSDLHDYEFIENITIEELDTVYKPCLYCLWDRYKNNPEDRENIILALHDQGMCINDILE